MSPRDKFDEICGQLCETRGWTRVANALEVPLEQGRKQNVQFEFFMHDGHEMVRVHTTIGSTRRIRPDRLIFALELNFGLPHGCLAVRNDDLVMVDTLILEEVDSLELESAVDYLAKTGDHYEATLFGRDDN
ncbi:MAG: hypothetical protein VCC04_05925 [Myxococcota bacterium]